MNYVDVEMFFCNHFLIHVRKKEKTSSKISGRGLRGIDAKRKSLDEVVLEGSLSILLSRVIRRMRTAWILHE